MSANEPFEHETADLKALHDSRLGTGHLEDAAWERLFEDRLSADERRAALDHIVACRACADVYRGLEMFEREAQALDPENRASSLARRPPGTPVWTQALAATLVVALAGWALLRRGPLPEHVPSAPAIRATAPVPAPGRMLLKPEVLIGAEHALALRGGEPASGTYVEQLQAALAAYRADRFDEAATALAALGTQYPDAVEPVLYQGISLLLLGRSREAVAPLERATQLAGIDLLDVADFHLALARRNSGDPKSAQKTLARLCESKGPYQGKACQVLETARVP